MLHIPSNTHHMSADAFAAMGIKEFVYVRPTIVNGRKTHMIHAADGTPLTSISNRKLAFATISQHDLTPMSLH